MQGHAYGAGMQLALACDLRFVADDVRMGLLELNWGLMPDLGGTVWLPRLVGPAKALELMLTGARLGADELLALGIVNRVVPAAELDATVDGFVAELLRRPPLAVRGREGCGARRVGRDDRRRACAPRPRRSSRACGRRTSSKRGRRSSRAASPASKAAEPSPTLRSDQLGAEDAFSRRASSAMAHSIPRPTAAPRAIPSGPQP